MISFVYFDVGGVVVADFSGTDKWAEMKRDIGITLEKDEEFDLFWDKYEKEVHVGRDVETLVPFIAEKFHLNFSKDYSLLSDFINRFEQNTFIWPVVDKIKKSCRVGLLTNMYPKMLPTMTARRLMPPVSWDVVIDSSIVGCQKPNIDIYEIAEKKINAGKENILFVDNTLENIDTAKNFGWQTFLYDSRDHENSSRRLLDHYEKNKK